MGDIPVRDAKLLSSIYQSCSIALFEITDFGEPNNDLNWMATTEEEFHMIEKMIHGS